MNPRELRDEQPDGAACAACGRAVPSERVRILARRDDLAFAEVPCEPCGSVSLAMFVGPASPLPSARAAADRAPDQDAAPIGPDDVLDMHLLLERWTGDLRNLVEA